MGESCGEPSCGDTGEDLEDGSLSVSWACCGLREASLVILSSISLHCSNWEDVLPELETFVISDEPEGEESRRKTGLAGLVVMGLMGGVLVSGDSEGG